MKPVLEMDVPEFSEAYQEEIAAFIHAHNTLDDPIGKLSTLLCSASYASQPLLMLIPEGDFRTAIYYALLCSTFCGMLAERQGWYIPEE